MKFSKYKYLVGADLYRITGKLSFGLLVKHLLLGESFPYVFCMRTCAYLRSNPLLRYTLYPIVRIRLIQLTYKLGISIPFTMQLGSGLSIAHFGEIFVNGHSVIGKNLTLANGVTIGKLYRGKKRGYPTIGDNVYIGPGAKILGNVRIGNNVAIGANAVVTNDIPDDAVAVGIPAKVISMEGSKGYVNRTDYDPIDG